MNWSKGKSTRSLSFSARSSTRDILLKDMRWFYLVIATAYIHAYFPLERKSLSAWKNRYPQGLTKKFFFDFLECRKKISFSYKSIAGLLVVLLYLLQHHLIDVSRGWVKKHDEFKRVTVFAWLTACYWCIDPSIIGLWRWQNTITTARLAGFSFSSFALSLSFNTLAPAYRVPSEFIDA